VSAQTFRFSLRAEPDIITANGISTTSITVQVPGSSSAFAATPVVRFLSSSGTIEPQARVVGGVARALLRSSTTPGTAIVTAIIGGSREQITVEFSSDEVSLARYLQVDGAYVAYNATGSMITASGKCALDYGDLRIESDVRLDVDLAGEKVWAQGSSGRVVIRNQKSWARARVARRSLVLRYGPSARRHAPPRYQPGSSAPGVHGLRLPLDAPDLFAHRIGRDRPLPKYFPGPRRLCSARLTGYRPARNHTAQPEGEPQASTPNASTSTQASLSQSPLLRAGEEIVGEETPPAQIAAETRVAELPTAETPTAAVPDAEAAPSTSGAVGEAPGAPSSTSMVGDAPIRGSILDGTTPTESIGTLPARGVVLGSSGAGSLPSGLGAPGSDETPLQEVPEYKDLPDTPAREARPAEEVPAIQPQAEAVGAPKVAEQISEPTPPSAGRMAATG
jgi:hypothetical protein